tara:strand:+ start:2969 stop:3169 length:201 start_codon:yes stop_codon:yes gene_type:complete
MTQAKEAVKAGVLLVVVGTLVSLAMDKVKLVPNKNHAKLVTLFVTGVVANVTSRVMEENKDMIPGM